MRKLMLLATALLISAFSATAQQITSEFFGLKLGDSYSAEQIKEKLWSYGTFMNETEDHVGDIPCRMSSFSNVRYLDVQFSAACINSLENGTFCEISFLLSEEFMYESQSFDNIFTQLKTKLTETYGNFEDKSMDDYPGWVNLYKDDNEISVKLYKWVQNGVSTLAVVYTSLDLVYPTIQDTFFRMKMGSFQKISSVKNNLYRKGEFISQDYISTGVEAIFKNVVFSGTTWDFGNFYFSDKGRFYEFAIYNSLNNEDERAKKEADTLYELYKNKLAEKYGKREEVITEDEKKIVYTGKNDMSIVLYNRVSKSNGGEYRRFVGIDYTQTEIYRRLLAVNDDEL